MSSFNFLSLLLLFSSLSLFAQEPLPRGKGLTPEQEQWLAQQNKRASLASGMRSRFLPTSNSPFIEFSPAGYIIFSAKENFNSGEIKQKIAQNLPPETDLVVLTDYANIIKTRQKYQAFIANERLHVLGVQGLRHAFWARDALPLALYQEDIGLELVDAQYYKPFKYEKKIADYFQAPMITHDFYHEGGNFLANSNGDCFITKNKRANQIPDELFINTYGCQKVIRMELISGIGHIDEHLKLIDENHALTDLDEYRVVMEKLGYRVTMLPRPQNHYETYVNSLIVGDTVFMPKYLQATDEKAKAVYLSVGLKKVVALDSRMLSNKGRGSIHCITMKYPPVDVSVVKNFLK